MSAPDLTAPWSQISLSDARSTAPRSRRAVGEPVLDALDVLELEAVHIFREVAGEFDRPVILFPGGKDSTPGVIAPILLICSSASESICWVPADRATGAALPWAGGRPMNVPG